MANPKKITPISTLNLAPAASNYRRAFLGTLAAGAALAAVASERKAHAEPSDPSPGSSRAPSPGVAKIVKLGAETILIIEIKEGDDLPEGEVVIKSIETRASNDAVTGANSSCGLNVCGNQLSQ